MATFTIDVQFEDGHFGEDHGLTAVEIANAIANAPKLGLRVLAVTEEGDYLSPANLLESFGVVS